MDNPLPTIIDLFSDSLIIRNEHVQFFKNIMTGFFFQKGVNRFILIEKKMRKG